MKKGAWVMSGGLADVVFLVFTVNGADMALAQQCTVGSAPGLPRRNSERPQFHNHPGTQSAVCLGRVGGTLPSLDPFPYCKVG